MEPGDDGTPIVVTLSLAGGQCAALFVGQEPGIACRLSGQRPSCIVVAPLALNGCPQQAGSLAACEESHSMPGNVPIRDHP